MGLRCLSQHGSRRLVAVDRPARQEGDTGNARIARLFEQRHRAIQISVHERLRVVALPASVFSRQMVEGRVDEIRDTFEGCRLIAVGIKHTLDEPDWSGKEVLGRRLAAHHHDLSPGRQKALHDETPDHPGTAGNEHCASHAGEIGLGREAMSGTSGPSWNACHNSISGASFSAFGLPSCQGFSYWK